MSTAKFIGGERLGTALIDAGFSLPRNCRNVRLITEWDNAVSLQFEVFLEPDDLDKVSAALARLAKEARS